MQDKMTYMVVIKPDGKTHIVVLDRGVVDCARAEEVAHALGEVTSNEVLPDARTLQESDLDQGED